MVGRRGRHVIDLNGNEIAEYFWEIFRCFTDDKNMVSRVARWRWFWCVWVYRVCAAPVACVGIVENVCAGGGVLVGWVMVETAMATVRLKLLWRRCRVSFFLQLTIRDWVIKYFTVFVMVGYKLNSKQWRMTDSDIFTDGFHVWIIT